MSPQLQADLIFFSSSVRTMMKSKMKSKLPMDKGLFMVMGLQHLVNLRHLSGGHLSEYGCHAVYSVMYFIFDWCLKNYYFISNLFYFILLLSGKISVATYNTTFLDALCLSVTYKQCHTAKHQLQCNATLMPQG